MAKAKTKSRNTSANLGFEGQLWAAADALRHNMDAAEYKHVVLGLIFLDYICDVFPVRHPELAAHTGKLGGIAIYEQGDVLCDGRHPDLKADYVLVNPPFNVSARLGKRQRTGGRWRYRARSGRSTWPQGLGIEERRP